MAGTPGIFRLTIVGDSTGTGMMLDMPAERSRFARRSAANECTYNHGRANPNDVGLNRDVFGHLSRSPVRLGRS